jgi:tetratricopeptide (TPR) repeat protein
MVLRDTGRHAEAEPLLRQALELRRAAREEDHPDVAQSLNNLAALLRDTGRHAEAEPLLRQALEVLHRVYGEDHPRAIQSLANLSIALRYLDQATEAEQIETRVRALREKRAAAEAHG